MAVAERSIVANGVFRNRTTLCNEPPFICYYRNTSQLGPDHSEPGDPLSRRIRHLGLLLLWLSMYFSHLECHACNHFPSLGIDCHRIRVFVQNPRIGCFEVLRPISKMVDSTLYPERSVTNDELNEDRMLNAGELMVIEILSR